MELDRYILCNSVSSIKGTLSRVCVAIMLLFVVVIFMCATVNAEELHVGSEEVYSTISGAVDAASEGDVVIVHAGNYTENVDVDKRITLQGEGADVVTVTAADPGDHIFDVCANGVNISGFTVTGATSSIIYDLGKAGFYLNITKQCSIFDNNASNNDLGISMESSRNNTLTNNTISNNSCGIWMSNCSNNILINNTALNSSSGNITTGGDYHPLVTTHSTKIFIENIVIDPEEKITVPLMINGPTNLGVCAININFNSSVLHVLDITPGDMGDLIYNFNNTTGWMYISVINRSGLSGNVIFAYLKLAATGSIDDTSLLDITVEQLYDIHYMPIDNIVSNGMFTITDNRPPVVTNASASRNTILNDNGRPRAPGTNITVLSAIITDAKSSSISKVTINLSSIGGSSVQPMERIPGTDIWEVTTNAVEGINHTHQLTINATDIRGNYNNSVNITLSVLRRGDVNRDNIIDSKDVIYIARYLVSLEPEYSNPPGILVADVVGISADPKGDGVVDLLDALYIKRYEVGLEDEP